MNIKFNESNIKTMLKNFDYLQEQVNKLKYGLLSQNIDEKNQSYLKSMLLICALNHLANNQQFYVDKIKDIFHFEIENIGKKDDRSVD